MSKVCKFSLVLIILFGCITTLIAESSNTPGFWHTIRWGETISDIAAQYGINPHLLAGVNDITEWDYILAGDVLWIPSGYTGNARTYVVRKNDYMLKIAKETGVSVWSLARANGIFNLDVIQPGQVLIVPAK